MRDRRVKLISLTLLVVTLWVAAGFVWVPLLAPEDRPVRTPDATQQMGSPDPKRTPSLKPSRASYTPPPTRKTRRPTSGPVRPTQGAESASPSASPTAVTPSPSATSSVPTPDTSTDPVDVPVIETSDPAPTDEADQDVVSEVNTAPEADSNT